MKKLKLTVLTPSKVVLDKKEVESVTLPALEGEMSVLYNHAPIMVQLKEGILRYRNQGEEDYFAVYWGFAEVIDNNVTVLAEDAELASEIDAQKVKQEYERAKLEKEKLTKKEDLEDLEIKLKKMIIEMRLSNLIKKKKK